MHPKERGPQMVHSKRAGPRPLLGKRPYAIMKEKRGLGRCIGQWRGPEKNGAPEQEMGRPKKAGPLGGAPKFAGPRNGE